MCPKKLLHLRSSVQIRVFDSQIIFLSFRSEKLCTDLMYWGTPNTFREKINRLQTGWKRENDTDNLEKKTFETGQQIANIDNRK